MMELINEMDWKFILGDILIPVAIFILGFLGGRTYEKRASAKVNGNNNTIIQNSKIISKVKDNGNIQ